MPKWLKIVLAVGLGSLVICGGVFGACVVWAGKTGKELMESGERYAVEGRRFGEGKNQEECLTEALTRVKSCGQLQVSCMMHSQFFFTGCAQAASPSPELCEGAPRPGEVLASSRWTHERCNGRGMKNDSGCQTLFGAVQSLCARPMAADDGPPELEEALEVGEGEPEGDAGAP